MIPAPNGWEEFENIVKSALELRWRTSDLTRHGRQGQKQNGVDIYGSDDLARSVGIQCKLTTNSINESLINTEVSNAEGFQPAISALFIATTSPSDVRLQQYVRTLSIDRVQKGKFPVSILFWTDIVQDLTKDIDTVKCHYPQMFPASGNSQPIPLNLRQRDINNLRWLLEYIDVDSIYYAIDTAPKSVDADFINTSYAFDLVRKNPSFYIYDEILRLQLNSWLDKWNEIIYTGLCIYDYQGNTNRLIFPMPMDVFRTQEERKLYEDLVVLYQQFQTLFYNFTNFVNQKYPEIDFKETNAKARQRNNQFRSGR